MILSGIGAISSSFKGTNFPSGNVYTSPSLIGNDVTISAFSPFNSGNSYLFTNTIDSFLNINADESWSVGTEDFTIEWFQRQINTSGFQRIFTVDDFPSIDIGVSVEDSIFYYWANSAFRFSSAGSTIAGPWYHFAVVRRNGETTVYRDGQIMGSSFVDTNNIINTTNNLTIGNENSPSVIAAFRGAITNFRWVKGLAVYEGNFTVPNSNLTLVASQNPYGGVNTVAIPDGYTKLLLIP
jgi:hypothetical protein